MADRLEMELVLFQKNVAANLKVLRHLYPERITQEGLAERTGIGRSWISLIETGAANNVTLKTLLTIWFFLAPRIPFMEIFACGNQTMEERIDYFAKLLKAKLSKAQARNILLFLEEDILYAPGDIAAFAEEHRFIDPEDRPKLTRILTKWAKQHNFPPPGDEPERSTPAWRGARWKEPLA